MPTSIVILIIAYFIIINIAGFVSMGMDKAKAKNHAWRIPEVTLFSIAILGGSIGSILGMQTFRHKTKHWYFAIGMPVIFFLQLALGILIYLKF